MGRLRGLAGISGHERCIWWPSRRAAVPCSQPRSARESSPPDGLASCLGMTANCACSIVRRGGQ
jgi:hypothetical protein